MPVIWDLGERLECEIGHRKLGILTRVSVRTNWGV